MTMLRNGLLVLSLVVSAGGNAAAQPPGLSGRFFAFDNGTGRGQLPLETQAEMLREMGYAGIGYTGCDEIPAMLRALDARKLKMFSTYVGVKVGPDGAAYDPRLKRAIQELAGRDTLIWLTIQGGKASSTEYDEQAAAAVREIAELAAASKLRVALYPHVGFYVASVEDALRLTRLVDRPNVGVSFNLCHFLKLDDERNMEALLQKALPRLFAVSINGADRGDTKTMGWDRLIQTLDRGDFDLTGFLRLLGRLGYEGPIGLQCYAIKGDMRENLQRSMTAWRKHVQAVEQAPSPSKSERVLEVPASERAVHAVFRWPADAAPPTQATARLVNVADPNETIVAQRVRSEVAEAESVHATNCWATTIPPRKGGPEPRRFRLAPVAQGPPDNSPAFQLREEEDVTLRVLEGDRPVLNYNFGFITCETVPKDDPRRTRACYVHPVWGLDGETLTDDFPKDHYHHHGIFWSWPHVLRDGQEYDLWTSKGIQQRFVRWLCREAGPVAAVVASENAWFVGEEKAMLERVCLRVFKADQDSRTVDLEFEWQPVGRPITLWGAEGKSYGGLTMRYAPRKETAITVPSGLTKEDLLETRLPWADFSAKYGDRADPSGVALFVSPRHPDFPPTWLTRHYGCLCIGWPGVVSKTFEPGQSIRLAYRVWIHRGQPEAATLEGVFSAYGAAVDLARDH